MSNPLPALRFQVQEQIFDAKGLKDEQNFYHQRQGSPSQLTRKLVYILGKQTSRYPIASMTLGASGYDPKNKGLKRSAVELDDTQFTYPVMGQMDKVSYTVKTDYDSNEKPGYGNQPFFLYFGDNWLREQYIIVSEGGVQAFVQTRTQTADGNWKYQVVLDPAAPTDYCDYRQTEAGIGWVELHTAVAESESRTTESKMVMPGMFKNQMGFLRHGISWAGNATKKVMKFDISTGDKTTNVWMDWAMYQFELQWLDQLEHVYWYSKYNRQANGTVALKDLLTGKIIPRGSGILEQIRNRSTYATLTYKIIADKIGDALYGIEDAANKNITLMTGTGGRREFHRAMLAQGATISASIIDGVADKFITGTGRSLALGGFFDSFYHVDGYVVKLKYNPLFDYGKMAQVSPKHPESGLPLESYRMVFIDDNDVDGMPNIQHVAQKGRSMVHGILQGLTDSPASLNYIQGPKLNGSELKMLMTDQDKSAYTRLASCGVQMLRGNLSFDMQCVAGL
jgi:hypothetical protein